MKNEPIKAVVSGDLNMMRCFLKTGIPTVLVSSDLHDVTLHSKQSKQKVIISSPQSEPEIAVEDLIDLGKNFTNKPVLFYGDDSMLLLISRNRDRLKKYYRFLLPDQDVVEDLVDKASFNKLASLLDLPVPKTIVSSEIGKIDKVTDHISFPCILKPTVHIGWFESSTIKKYGGRPQKVLKAHSLEELKQIYEQIKQFSETFLLQEYIPGSDDCIYSFHSYYDKNSNPLGFYIGRKIRTYPKDSGVSTYLELVKEPKLAEISMEILRRLKFKGPVKLDFKKDKNRNSFYLLEINPRFNLWHYLGTICGVNLPLIAYNDLTGNASAHTNGYRTGVKWLSFGNDLRAFIRDYHPEGDLTFLQWLLSYRGRKIYDIFSWTDPYPFAVNMTIYLKALFKRLTKGVEVE